MLPGMIALVVLRATFSMRATFSRREPSTAYTSGKTPGSTGSSRSNVEGASAFSAVVKARKTFRKNTGRRFCTF